MNQAGLDSLLSILRRCAEAAPNPWYPSQEPPDATPGTGGLEANLDRLRLSGLIQLTDWVQGRGQGYVLTPAGAQLLENPRQVALLRDGVVTAPMRQSERHTEEEDDSERARAIRAIARRPSTPVVTIGLIVVNVLWFLAGMVDAYLRQVPLNDYLSSPPKQILLDIGALSGEPIMQGQWWRLLSSCFVHIGWLHLALNMWSLYVLGRIQEGLWGHFRLLVIYLIAGFGGSCAMVITNPYVVGAGASGAIFGLMSSLAVWLVLNRRFLGEAATSLLRRLMFVFLLNVFISALPQISASAHFGGAATGLVAAVLIHEQRFRRGVLRWLCTAGILALPVLWFGAVREAPRFDERWDVLDWQNRLNQVNHTELKPAQDIHDTKIKPLFRNQKVYSLSEIREALASSQEIRTHLDRARESLDKAGPYRVKEAEEERQAEIHRLTKARSQSEEEESRLAGYLAADANREASSVQKKVNQRLPTDPKTRNAEDVNDSIVALQEAKARLLPVMELLKNAGPYEDQKAEGIRRDWRDILEAREQLLGSLARRLQKGIAWTQEEQKEFDRQQKRINDLLNPSK